MAEKFPTTERDTRCDFVQLFAPELIKIFRIFSRQFSL